LRLYLTASRHIIMTRKEIQCVPKNVPLLIF